MASATGPPPGAAHQHQQEGASAFNHHHQGVARVRPPSFSLWSVGEGWEGTPADWTDYICLTIAFFSLVLWLHQKNPSYLTEPELERIHQESSGGGADEGADELEEVVEEEEKTSAEGKKVQ